RRCRLARLQQRDGRVSPSERTEREAGPVQLVHQQRPRSAQRDVALVEGEDPRVARRAGVDRVVSSIDEDLPARSAAARSGIERLTAQKEKGRAGSCQLVPSLSLKGTSISIPSFPMSVS